MVGTAKIEPLLRRIRNSMAGAGMRVENAKGECNLGQHEINFHYGPALQTADEHSIYKTGAKEIAAQEGYSISFMAKFNEREGSSCHVHLSLAGDDGSPVFADQPEVFDAFVAGVLATLRELTLFHAPNINSYKRFQPGSFAPTAVAWGNDNRTCSVRVVGHGPAKRIECRLPGADVNPYLTLAALIAGGLHGVENELELEPAYEGSAYDSRQAARPVDAARRARPVRGQRRRAVGVRRRGRRALPQQRAGGARRVRRGGHGLGALPRIRAAMTTRQAPPSDSVFAPVRSQTAFEEALDRLGTAIKLGLLAPGTQLPAERELCARLEISRSTLRQALTALVQSGHLRAARGRGGGTFVADRPPPAEAPTVEQLAGWQDALDARLAVELGVALLAAERADGPAIAALERAGGGDGRGAR